ncbi:hypothetical protein J2X34_002653 [Rhodococcus sp. BE178]
MVRPDDLDALEGGHRGALGDDAVYARERGEPTVGRHGGQQPGAHLVGRVGVAVGEQLTVLALGVARVEVSADDDVVARRVREHLAVQAAQFRRPQLRREQVGGRGVNRQQGHGFS